MAHESKLSLTVDTSALSKEFMTSMAEIACDISEQLGDVVSNDQVLRAMSKSLFKRAIISSREQQISETQSRQIFVLKEVIEASRLYPFDNLQDAAKEVNAALKILEDGTKPDRATSRSGTL